ncbi:MAG: pilus assembly protein PilP [Proteobacteria bacterium]|nr:pilus assembly protein PilP [Pseudomonadota bacterium]HQR05053.1 pilus assembly protein PilP [Rhodocyclaceae bacterium]
MMRGQVAWGMMLIAAFTLVACSGGEPGDIREWMRESSKDLKARVPPLPEMQSPPVLVYEPGDLASPFSTDKLFAGDAAGAGAGQLASGKAVNTDAYPLTRAPLETLRLVGTITIGKEVVALVAMDRAAPYQVRVGDFIGQNLGKVIRIRPATDKDDAEITVKESVFEKGVWVERENRLPLPSSQGDKG